MTFTEQTDRNAVICDANNYFVNLDDATLFSVIDQINFYQYPDTFLDPHGTYSGFITDTIFSYIIFKVKNGKILKNISIQVIATDGKDSFVLQEQDFDPSSFLDQNNISQINTSQTNGFNLDRDDVRNASDIRRRPGDDAGGYSFYEILYGFKLRHEVWRQVTNSTPTFVNNNTEKWSIYSKQPSWVVNYVLRSDVADPNTGHTTEFTQTAILTIKDETDTLYPTTIQTFADSGTTDIQTNILKDEITTIKASFTGDFSSFPAGANAYYGLLYIDIQYQGGYTFIDQVASDTDPIPSSIWIQKATLTKVNNGLITLTADINFAKLDKQVDRYLLMARLGYRNYQPDVLETDSGVPIHTDSDVQLEVD